MLEPLANGAPTGDLQIVTTALTAPQARADFDAIGGASIVELRRGAAAFAHGFGETMDTRLRHPQAARVLVAGPAAAPASDERGFWIRAGSAGTSTDGDGNAFSHDLRGESIAAGADARVGSSTVAGVAISAGRQRLEFDAAGDRGRSRHAAIGAYAVTNDPRFLSC